MGVNVVFSFEFLCEGKVLYDNFYFVCIVVGDCGECGWLVVEVLCEVVFDVDVLVLFINSMEVEVIKLFVNIFLVMRVVFFNELDMFIVICGLDLC